MVQGYGIIVSVNYLILATKSTKINVAQIRARLNTTPTNDRLKRLLERGHGSATRKWCKYSIVIVEQSSHVTIISKLTGSPISPRYVRKKG